MPLFYATFGTNQFHPVTGQNLAFSYVELDARSSDEAEAIMWERFGGKWFHVVDEKPVPFRPEPHVVEAWKQARWTFMSSPAGGPLTRVLPPASGPEPLGETVTLRVVLSKDMARENALFLCGRCVAHRPGPECVTEHGAGVWPESNMYPTKEWAAARAFAIHGEGVTLLVRYVAHAVAREAAEKDPAHVSIVAATESLGYLGFAPDGHMGPRQIAGVFSTAELEALARFAHGYEVLQRAAWKLFGDDEGQGIAEVTPKPRAPGQTAEEARDDFFSLKRAEASAPRRDGPSGSGFFTMEMLDALSEDVDVWRATRDAATAAIARVESVKNWRDSVVGADVREGRVVGVRLTSR